MSQDRKNQFTAVEREIVALSQADDVLAEIYRDYQELLNLAQMAATRDEDLERSIDGLESELRAHLSMRNIKFAGDVNAMQREKKQR